MQNLEVYTEQALETQIRDRAKSNEWYVITFRGFAFKIYNRWAQVKQTPEGMRDSGQMGHRSAKSLIDEIVLFIRQHEKVTP